MRHLLWAAALLGVAVVSSPAQDARIDLSGTWNFEGGAIFLPGSTDQAGYGRKPVAPEKGWLSRPAIFEGTVHFERDIVIPPTWRGKRVTLFLERPHWQTELLVDGRWYGRQNSLTTPHVYDLGEAMTPGRHHISLSVDNTYQIDVGRDAHSVGEHTQTNWNGVVGRIELRATDPVWIEDVQAFPNARGRSARVEVTLRNATGKAVDAVLSAGAATVRLDALGAQRKIGLNVPLGASAKLWDEYEGNLQELEVTLAAGGMTDRRRVSFGLREFDTKGRQFLLNGRVVNLRGTLECNIFPLTGYPPMTKDAWARLYRIAKEHGLNHFRFHSWCPPEAAFAAADKAGFLLHVELPVWSGKVGLDSALDAFMRQEGFRILRVYGNHPSFVALCLGNELRGDNKFMDELVGEFIQADSRRLYTFSADYSRLEPGETSEYYVAQRTKSGYFRIHGQRFDQSAGGTDYDFTKQMEDIRVPVVAHELGQWVTYPDFREIGKYTGVLKARNLEVFRWRLEENGMGDQAAAFQQASGRFAWKLYKEDIETCLRTPEFGGYQLLQLQDFPGQGEALIGLLDSFWDSKGILTAEEMRRFAGPTVPLARFEKFVWTNDEVFKASALVAHYGKGPLKGPARWLLRDDAGVSVASGQFKPVASVPGSVAALGEIRFALNGLKRAARLRLIVEAAGFSNDWAIWVYPKSQPEPAEPDVFVTGALDDAARQKLEQGGRVLLLAKDMKGQEMKFLPVFWSLSWFPKQPETMGVLCDPRHPALSGFPNDGHSNFQWYELTQNARAFVLDGMPMGLRPVVQVIDDYHRNHRLGAVVEARIGKGRLLAVSFDLATNLDARPVARQLRTTLLRYAASPEFDPRVELSMAELKALLER